MKAMRWGKYFIVLILLNFLILPGTSYARNLPTMKMPDCDGGGCTDINYGGSGGGGGGGTTVGQVRIDLAFNPAVPLSGACTITSIRSAIEGYMTSPEGEAALGTTMFSPFWDGIAFPVWHGLAWQNDTYGSTWVEQKELSDPADSIRHFFYDGRQLAQTEISGNSQPVINSELRINARCINGNPQLDSIKATYYGGILRSTVRGFSTTNMNADRIAAYTAVFDAALQNGATVLPETEIYAVRAFRTVWGSYQLITSYEALATDSILYIARPNDSLQWIQLDQHAQSFHMDITGNVSANVVLDGAYVDENSLSPAPFPVPRFMVHQYDTAFQCYYGITDAAGSGTPDITGNYTAAGVANPGTCYADWPKSKTTKGKCGTTVLAEYVGVVSNVNASNTPSSATSVSCIPNGTANFTLNNPGANADTNRQLTAMTNALYHINVAGRWLEENHGRSPTEVEDVTVNYGFTSPGGNSLYCGAEYDPGSKTIYVPDENTTCDPFDPLEADRCCYNMAERSVVQHEYAHIVHKHIYPQIFNDTTKKQHAMSEGFADIFAAMLGDSPVIASGIYKDGRTNNWVRNLEDDMNKFGTPLTYFHEDCLYIQNPSGQSCIDYSTNWQLERRYLYGQILANIFWQYRKLVEMEEGDTKSADAAIINVMKQYPDTLSEAIDLLLLEDDTPAAGSSPQADADMSNGSPHHCVIQALAEKFNIPAGATSNSYPGCFLTEIYEDNSTKWDRGTLTQVIEITSSGTPTGYLLSGFNDSNPYTDPALNKFYNVKIGLDGKRDASWAQSEISGYQNDYFNALVRASAYDEANDKLVVAGLQAHPPGWAGGDSWLTTLNSTTGSKYAATVTNGYIAGQPLDNGRSYQLDFMRSIAVLSNGEYAVAGSTVSWMNDAAYPVVDDCSGKAPAGQQPCGDAYVAFFSSSLGGAVPPTKFYLYDYAAGRQIGQDIFHAVKETTSGNVIVSGVKAMGSEHDGVLILLNPANAAQLDIYETNNTNNDSYRDVIETAHHAQQGESHGYVAVGFRDTQGVLIEKFNTSLNKLWTNTYAAYEQGTQTGISADSIVELSDGSFIISASVGDGLPTTEEAKLMLLRVNADGTLDWCHAYENFITHNRGSQLAIGYDSSGTNEDGVVVVGRYENLMPPFGPAGQTAAVMKVGLNGSAPLPKDMGVTCN